VLYLLHGHGGQGPLDWLINGNAESIVDASPHPDLIVVIPDGGYDGWYSDWYGRDQYDPSTAPPPAWETFHIGQLIPWVDSTFHTLDGRAGRAIAGLSMGGFGSMSYAARHPDLFAAAGSFSGAVNTDIDWPVGSTAELAAANLPDGQRPDNCIWGDPVTQHDVWQAHNPTSRAASLAGVSLYIASGDGTPGPADLSKQPQSLAGQAASEAGIRMMNEQFIDALNQAGVAHTANLYSPGVHDWPYWRTDLANFLAWLVLPSA
jgi:S-formylglutathione hydrolase FrmB